MKKLFLLGLVMLCLFVFIRASGGGELPSFLEPARKKPPCTGYTIIEYGKGLNCQGDTIALYYPNGFAEAALP
jgi:hypothetical protein